ncbi:hypothetical protein BIV57_10990 [Mangrovactinospora gilvigrisea]|uniref:Peptidase inhibitor family I36 n=1 Tax=Mangrovactinospora gilvigrisea TaxID=1428644 RepID=A0A1J7BFY2_9ACTN|nr:peptidase inhibitor family I36 protein [Mangrovactinospora gilvigrisea]OIV37485.1 hypothetical protein BIV57_10990 [Mangrovactinospora gilvigrisea]
MNLRTASLASLTATLIALGALPAAATGKADTPPADCPTDAVCAYTGEHYTGTRTVVTDTQGGLCATIPATRSIFNNMKRGTDGGQRVVYPYADSNCRDAGFADKYKVGALKGASFDGATAVRVTTNYLGGSPSRPTRPSLIHTLLKLPHTTR